MLTSIPFKIPTEFSGQLEAGLIERFGAVLKDKQTGQVVAHLQETGVGESLLGNLGSFALSPFTATADILSSLGANIQLMQLKKMVEGLQMLQYANLGATVAGIGVSAAGFIILHKKLSKMETQITELSEHIDQRFIELHMSELRRHFSRVCGLYERADHANYLKNPVNEWMQIAGQLADESSYFRGEIGHLLKQDGFDSGLFKNLLQSYSLCNSGRIECLMLASEPQCAKVESESMGRHFSTLFDNLTPNDLAHRSIVGMTDSDDKPRKLNEQRREMEALVQGLRDMHDSLLTQPMLIETLIEKEIDTREYVTRLTKETEHPLLLLPHIQ